MTEGEQVSIMEATAVLESSRCFSGIKRIGDRSEDRRHVEKAQTKDVVR